MLDLSVDGSPVAGCFYDEADAGESWTGWLWIFCDDCISDLRK